MDVSAASGPGSTRPRDHAATVTRVGMDAERDGRRAAVRRVAEEAAAVPVHDPPAVVRAGEARKDGLNLNEIPVPARTPPPAKESSKEGFLKFDVVAADVLARFSIDEETKRVTVTMFQRDTGELIREFPPRGVLDVMSALAGRGLAVDVAG